MMSKDFKKVCMLTSRHSYDDARIYHKESKTLIEEGYSVTLIVPYNGKEVKRDDISICFFNKTRYFRKLITLFNLIKLGLKEKANIYHCHEGDSSLLAGVIIKFILSLRKKKVILIYDSHEFWALFFEDKVSKVFKTTVKWAFVFYENFLLKFCDAVITANEIEKSYFHFLDHRKPVVTLYNVPKLSLFKKDKNSLKNRRYSFCHEGNIAFKRGLKPLMNALIYLHEKRDDWNFLFIGDAQDKSAKDYIEKVLKDNPKLRKHIKLTGWLPYESVGKYISLCKVGCILFEPTGNNKIGGPPGKLFNYMCYGMPVIAPAYPEIKKIIMEANCGILLYEISSKNIVQALEKMLDDEKLIKQLGENGKKAVIKGYNWELEREKLINLYKMVDK